MPFYEIITEPGNKMVAFYEDDDECQRAISEHHRRAINGEPGTPQSTPRSDLAPGEVPTVGTWPAERIKKVLVYAVHPSDYADDHIVDADALRETFEKVMEESSMQGSVHVPTIAAAIRDESSAIAQDVGVHDSQFKMKEDKTLDISYLKDLEA